MAGEQAQQGACRAIGLPTVLLPVLEGVDTDADAAGELLLGQRQETPQGDQVA